MGNDLIPHTSPGNGWTHNAHRQDLSPWRAGQGRTKDEGSAFAEFPPPLKLRREKSARPAVAEGYGVAGKWLSVVELAADQPSQEGYGSASTAASTPRSRGQRPRLQFPPP